MRPASVAEDIERSGRLRREAIHHHCASWNSTINRAGRIVRNVAQ
jgi:hypothetical protein